MSIKRRSNWYIYLITFVLTVIFIFAVISMFSWFLFPDKSIMANQNINNNYSMEFEAQNNHSLVFMAMLSEEKGAAPDEFAIVSYQAIDNAVVFIPLSKDIKATVNDKNGDLKYLYESVGAEAVLTAIKNQTNIECTKYIKFDKESFISFADSVGSITINIRDNMVYSDTTSEKHINFEAGEQTLSGKGIYDYITFPSFTDDERLNAVGSVMAAFVNQNCSGISESLLQTYYNKLINNSVNNFTMDDLTYRMQAFMNTIESTSSPAEYYIPYGIINDNGVYELSANSIKTMQQKTGQNSD